MSFKLREKPNKSTLFLSSLKENQHFLPTAFCWFLASLDGFNTLFECQCNSNATTRSQPSLIQQILNCR